VHWDSGVSTRALKPLVVLPRGAAVLPSEHPYLPMPIVVPLPLVFPTIAHLVIDMANPRPPIFRGSYRLG
jgi:hypothetical protein